MDNAESTTNFEALQREAPTHEMTPCNVLCLICRYVMLILFVSSGVPGADAASSTPEQAGVDPRKRIDFEQPEGEMIKAIPKFSSAQLWPMIAAPHQATPRTVSSR